MEDIEEVKDECHDIGNESEREDDENSTYDTTDTYSEDDTQHDPKDQKELQSLKYFVDAPIQYNTNRRNRIKLLSPVKHTNKCYIWKELYAKLQHFTQTIEVFARTYIRPGILIPILGLLIRPDAFETSDIKYRHPWTYLNNNASMARGYRSMSPDWMENQQEYTPTELNQTPTTYENVPLWGLGIHRIIRRSSYFYSCNCVYWNNHILIIQPIQPHTEVVVYFDSSIGSNKDYLKMVIKKSTTNTFYKGKYFYVDIMKQVHKRTYMGLKHKMEKMAMKVNRRYRRFMKKTNKITDEQIQSPNEE